MRAKHSLGIGMGKIYPSLSSAKLRGHIPIDTSPHDHRRIFLFFSRGLLPFSPSELGEFDENMKDFATLSER